MLRAFWYTIIGAPVAARLVNVTIDDYYGDERTGKVPLYDNGHKWNAARETCDCAVQLDASQMYKRTWCACPALGEAIKDLTSVFP